MSDDMKEWGLSLSNDLFKTVDQHLRKRSTDEGPKVILTAVSRLLGVAASISKTAGIDEALFRKMAGDVFRVSKDPPPK